jgi:hypothetical protein
MIAPLVSEAVFPRIVPGGIAESDRRDDLPALPQYAYRCAVDVDLTRGNIHALRVHHSPQGDARDRKRKNKSGCKDGFHGNPSGDLSCFDAGVVMGDSACSACVGNNPPRQRSGRTTRSGDWIRRATVIKWRYLHDAKEESMAVTKTIRKEIGNIEVQLKKRVLSLEKDLANLGKKLEKKETEVKKLKDKMTSKFVKNVKKKVKKAKKEVAKRLTDIF